MSHVVYAALSGGLVGASWAVLDPLGLGTFRATAAGFVLGVVGYTLIAVASALDS